MGKEKIGNNMQDIKTAILETSKQIKAHAFKMDITNIALYKALLLINVYLRKYKISDRDRIKMLSNIKIDISPELEDILSDTDLEREVSEYVSFIVSTKKDFEKTFGKKAFMDFFSMNLAFVLHDYYDFNFWVKSKDFFAVNFECRKKIHEALKRKIPEKVVRAFIGMMTVYVEKDIYEKNKEEISELIESYCLDFSMMYEQIKDYFDSDEIFAGLASGKDFIVKMQNPMNPLG